jgi:UDP-N-acetylglucosamine acyltransferase
MIAGHVVVGDFVAMMGGVGVHHFVTIGPHAYLGGYCRIHHDVPPFVKVDGSDQIRGLNKVGLSRAKFSAEDIAALENAYRRLFLRKRPFALAMMEFEDLDSLNPQVRYLIEFLRRRDEGKHGRYLEGLRAKESPADYFEVAQVLPNAAANAPQAAPEPEPVAAESVAPTT